jgi:formylglycine-generating enzyme required for sulfatase activity
MEWCWDWYGTYAAGSQTNPRGTTSGSNRVCRGGSWYYYVAYSSRVALRYGNDPALTNGLIGFRVLRSLAP